jgi:hypothetical protein
MKINENKSKQNSFPLLTFIFSNRDFSMGYGRFKQKNPARVAHTQPGPPRPNFSILLSPSGRWTRAPGDPADRKRIAQVEILAKEMSTLLMPAVVARRPETMQK